MDDPRLSLWEPLFRHALGTVDGAERSGQRLVDREATLREDFAQFDVRGEAPSYDECVARVRRLFRASGRRGPRKKSALR